LAAALAHRPPPTPQGGPVIWALFEAIFLGWHGASRQILGGKATPKLVELFQTEKNNGINQSAQGFFFLLRSPITQARRIRNYWNRRRRRFFSK